MGTATTFVDPKGNGKSLMDTMPKMRAPQPFLLPQWAEQVWSEQSTPLPTLDDRMRFAIRLAAMNEQHSGHPFGAAVFERESGAPVAIGINLVMQTNCSLSHAEMVALAYAQRQVGRVDPQAAGRAPHQLVTSCAPCAMCLGALSFSGVQSVVCGARSGDAEAIGFEQGRKPEPWTAALEQRGIAVIQDVARQEAIDVLLAYQRGVHSQ